MPTRNETLKAAFEAANIPNIGLDRFKHALMDWHVYAVEVQGDLAGAILHKGSEIHACILPEYRGKWFSRKIIKDIVFPTIKAYGKITTAVPDDKPWGRDFVEKFGFKKLRHENGATYYELRRCKYGHWNYYWWCARTDWR